MKSVGVRDGKRVTAWAVIIRAVNTVDAIEASVERLPWDLMEKLTARITKEVKGVNEISSTPVGYQYIVVLQNFELKISY